MKNFIVKEQSNVSTAVRATSVTHIASLDGIRGIAVTLVLLYHGSGNLFKGGWIGVDLFFALSGFLITWILLKEKTTSGTISFGRFYARRALRLLPALLLGVLLANVLWRWSALGFPHARRPIATLASLLYGANLVDQDLLGPLSHMWSLAVEEHFYFAWPVLAALLASKSTRKIGALLCAVIIAAGISRIVAYKLDVMSDLSLYPFILNPYRFTPMRMGAILLGSLLAFGEQRGLRPFPQLLGNATVLVGLLLMLLAAAVLLPESSSFFRYGGFFLTDMLCALIVASAIQQPTFRVLTSKILRWIGARSYGIYVYHFPIFLACEVLRKRPDVLNFLWVYGFRVAVTLSVAAVSFRFIEQPILQLKKRLPAA